MNRLATYLYGFTRPSAVIPAGLAGIEEESPVRIDLSADLAAVVSEVPVGPFESDAVADIDWLVPRALRHEHVIERIQYTAPVLPVRFGALFSDALALGIWASSHRPAIEGFLEHVAGKQEWSLKIEFDVSGSLELLAETDPQWAERVARLSTSPGARYFQEKRLREEARAHGVRAARLAAERVRKAVRLVAEERILSRRNQDKPNMQVVLDAAYLVGQHDATRFFGLAHEAVAPFRYLSIDISGPWPASHFCPELSTAASGGS